MDPLDLVQWPAMLVTVVAAWKIGSRSPERRQHGFWWFLSGNVLWVIWGWHTQAWALIVLQCALAGLNIRGSSKNSEET